jgi:hypothetical protein
LIVCVSPNLAGSIASKLSPDSVKATPFQPKTSAAQDPKPTSAASPSSTPTTSPMTAKGKTQLNRKNVFENSML